MQNRPFLTGLGFIVLFFLATLGRTAHLENPRQDQMWSGWTVLLVDGREDLDSVLPLLNQEGFTAVSRYNQTFQLQDYGRMKTISLIDYETLLEPLDPRIDPYMQGVGEYFSARDASGETWEIFYINDADSALPHGSELSAVLEESGLTYALPERENHSSRAFSVLGLMFFLILGLTNPGAWKEVLFYSLPWIAALGTGEPELLFSNNLAAYGMLLMGRDVRRLWKHQIEYPVQVPHLVRQFMKTAFPGGFLLIGSLAFLVLSRRPGFVPGILLGITAHTALITAEMSFLLWRSRRRLHRLFHPLPLVQGNKFITIPPLGQSALIAVSLMLLPLSAELMIRETDWELPLPEPVSQAISWDNLAHEWAHGAPENLPGLQDFLAHRAYQEGFFYGGVYEFPGAGDKIGRSRFAIQEGKVIEEEVSLVAFDNEWFVNSLDSSSASGVPQILLTQGRLSRVGVRHWTIPKPEPLWTGGSLAFIILFVAFFHLAGTVRRRRTWYGGKRELAVPLAALYSGDSGVA